MTPALAIDSSLLPLAGLFVLLVAGVLLRRVPVIGPVLGLASWGALLFALYMAFDERSRLDPEFGRVTGLFRPDRQQVAGNETRIAMAPDGHFWVQARLADGVERRMLVDSGATITALSERTASAAGLTPTDGPFPIILRTANGQVRAQTADVPELRLGNIVARDLTVVVSPAFGTTDVIGMNFLSRLASWRVEGRTLILTPHHPQDAAG